MVPEIIPALFSAPPPTEILTPLSSIKPEAPFPLSLASLPSSFTTLLLSIVDSPAYANLTTSYLTHVFNPQTPDDPHVRYFSVAGRTEGVGIWHPLWLPKMILDGVEERTRQRLKDEWEREHGMYVDRSIGYREDVKDDQKKPLWLREDEWGNDGLVTVQSARWGEFLGTMEGCDHWTMRGARGMELGVDLKAIGGGGGNNGPYRSSSRRALAIATEHANGDHSAHSLSELPGQRE
jgi:triacylglycerol lipase